MAMTNWLKVTVCLVDLVIAISYAISKLIFNFQNKYTVYLIYIQIAKYTEHMCKEKKPNN